MDWETSWKTDMMLNQQMITNRELSNLNDKTSSSNSGAGGGPIFSTKTKIKILIGIVIVGLFTMTAVFSVYIIVLFMGEAFDIDAVFDWINSVLEPIYNFIQKLENFGIYIG